MLKAPVPTFGTRPRIISDEGVYLMSSSQLRLAFVKNLTQVSKLIFKNGEMDSSIHYLFMALILPL